MTVREFTQVLVAECEADQSTAFVDSLIKDARAAMGAGKGSVGSITSGSVNGKSFTKQIDLSPLEVLSAARLARQAYLGDEDRVASTYADFSCLNR